MALSLRENIAQARTLKADPNLLLQRAEFLCDPDRELVEAVLIRGQSAASLARLMQAAPRAIRKRVHQIRQRMLSKEFLAAARAIGYLAQPEADLARLRYCDGLSQRQLCSRMALTEHALRRRLDALSAKIETITRMTTSGRSQRWKQ